MATRCGWLPSSAFASRASPTMGLAPCSTCSGREAGRTKQEWSRYVLAKNGSECLGSATLIKNVATPFSLGEAGTGTILKTSVSEPNVVGGGGGNLIFIKSNFNYYRSSKNKNIFYLNLKQFTLI